MFIVRVPTLKAQIKTLLESSTRNKRHITKHSTRTGDWTTKMKRKNDAGPGGAAVAKQGKVEQQAGGHSTHAVETVVVHGGNQRSTNSHGALMPPITTATSFMQPNLGDGGEFCYSRVGNPTRMAYETALADLENGVRS
jgi:hypothetical protein